MSHSPKISTAIDKQSERDGFYNRQAVYNNNNNDDSFISINYAQTNEPIGDANPLRNEAANISGKGNVIDQSRVMVMASPSASMKELKKNYHLRKKYFTRNIQSAIDSTQEVHSGWLKARTTFKRWTKTWCQVKPGYLILYTSQEALKKHRLGVVLLSVCQVIKRPTKKDGFCFKLINPFGCSVWAKSSTKAIVFAQASLTLRVSDESIGKLWLDALHRCQLSSNLEGYQPIINDDDENVNHGSVNDSRLGDTGGESSGDEGEHSARQIECLLDNSNNSTSDDNSLSSTPRHTIMSNNASRQSNGRFMINGGGGGGLGGSALKMPLRGSGSRTPISMASSNGGRLVKSKNQNDASAANRYQTNNNVIQQQHQQHEALSQHNSAKPVVSMSNINHSLIKQVVGNLISSNQSTAVPSGSTGNAFNLNCSKMVAKFSKYDWRELQLENVHYIEDGIEELGSAGMQSEEVHESNKNFLWHIIKQLRPGMDLSKVTLPTFILEPRSFLEKLADYYYHCDILSEAVLINEPVERLINIVKWYLSGFYKKPKGPKKPYNPILGERFRCFWDHPKTKSRTFFVAEQVSHHPPISAFHVTNRKDGYTITCALLSRSKYGGNSVSAILDGKARLHLTKRNETYTVTMPYANCRGILLGSLCLELGGKVEIECSETNCKCELDFKLASMWANQSSYNTLTGKILRDNKVTHTLDGHWDKKINIVDKTCEKKSILWEVTDSVRSSRLKRYTVSVKDQDERESVKLWSKVTEALIAGNQVVATAEKTRLEDMQRREARERLSPFVPRHFQHVAPGHGDWTYRWQDDRIWDERRDIMQFEDDFRIRTLMLSALDSQGVPTGLITDNDLPLTRLSRLAAQVHGLSGGGATEGGVGQATASASLNLGRVAAGSSSSTVGDLSEETVRNIESRIAAGNLLFEEALKQVTEKNRKLEEDIATLKRARGKRTLALLMTSVFIALICAIYKFLS